MLEHAYAKLNLSLDVLGRADDGYHEMRMVMQTVRFGDEVEVELSENGSFYIDPGLRYLPADGRNLAMRAAKLFLAGSGLGARIRIRKRIPVCAGMAGGSADAAAVLRALNRLTGAERTPEQLCAMGRELGSDVPFCVTGGTALAEGRGDRLTCLPPLPDCAVVICKPSFSISTPELFGRVDRRKSRLHPDTAGMADALRAEDLSGAARRMYNVFEDVLGRRQDVVDRIKSELLDRGAEGASMTGTGSAVFGLFSDDAAARSAQAALRARYSGCWLTRPAPAVSLPEADQP